MNLSSNNFVNWFDSESVIGNNRMGFVWFLVAAIAHGVWWLLLGNNYRSNPFSILTTWFHEIGHGIAILLLGGGIRGIKIDPGNQGLTGNGVTYPDFSRFPLDNLGRALSFAAGPITEPIVGSGLIVASGNPQISHACLIYFGTFVIVSALIWGQWNSGFVTLCLMSLLTILIAIKTPLAMQAFVIQFLSIQFCIDMFRSIPYLFNYMGGKSDTGQIDKSLFFPYWFWGFWIMIGSFLAIAASIRFTYFPKFSL